MSAGDLPPGPRLPAAVQTLASVARPLGFARWYHRRYGDVCTIRVHPVGPVVCVADATLVRELLSADPEVLRAGDANSLLDFVVGPSSLLLLDGAGHARSRRAMLPAFRGRGVRGQAATVDRVVRESVRRWPVGTEFALAPRMQDLTLEIMMRTVFGISRDDDLAGLRETLPHLLHMNPLLLLYPRLRRDLGPRSPGGLLAHRQRTVDGILSGEIARRRRDPGSGGDDVLSLLLEGDGTGDGFDDRELRDHLVTLLAVGHETTATALSWCADLVLHHPAVAGRLRAAVAAGDDAYPDAVLKETLRVRPVIGDVARVPSEPVRIGDHDVPAGVMVALSLALVHADPAIYPEPERFRPERFLDGPVPSPFLPFGGGPHRCLGASFAMMVMRSVLSVVLAHDALRPARAAPDTVRATGPVLTPARGVPVVLGTAFDAAPGSAATAVAGAPHAASET